jgi:hypothetical protein
LPPPTPVAPRRNASASPTATPVASPVRLQGAAVAMATASLSKTPAAPMVDLTAAAATAAAAAADPIEVLSDSDEELGSDDDEPNEAPAHTTELLPQGLIELQQDGVRAPSHPCVSTCVLTCMRV